MFIIAYYFRKTRLKLQGVDFFQETLINSEFPQHMDVLPFSVADKPLKMKNKDKIVLTRILHEGGLIISGIC